MASIVSQALHNCNGQSLQLPEAQRLLNQTIAAFPDESTVNGMLQRVLVKMLNFSLQRFETGDADKRFKTIEMVVDRIKPPVTPESRSSL